MATSGKLMRYLDEGTLREKLVELLWEQAAAEHSCLAKGHVM